MVTSSDWPELAHVHEIEAAHRPEWRRAFAAELGVEEAALAILGVGFDPRLACAVLPMRGAAGEVVGLQRRFRDGRKRTAYGSSLGYFGPTLDAFTHLRPDTLIVTEGGSDALAGWSIGGATIGRATASYGQHDAGALVACTGRHVVVVQDVDDVGRAGAARFAAQAMRYARSVRVVTPPIPHRDLRSWLRGGLTRAGLAAAVATTAPLRVQVTGVARAS